MLLQLVLLFLTHHAEGFVHEPQFRLKKGGLRLKQVGALAVD